MKKTIELIGAFCREEDGIALTEYLILLGLLVGAILVAVAAAGNNIAAAWDSWGTFWTTTVSYSP